MHYVFGSVNVEDAWSTKQFRKWFVTTNLPSWQINKNFFANHINAKRGSIDSIYSKKAFNYVSINLISTNIVLNNSQMIKL